jgi:hypothetical protein
MDVVPLDDPLILPTSPTGAESTPPLSLPTDHSQALFQLPRATHADRIASAFVQESRKLTKISDAQKASTKIRKDADEAERKALNTELSILLAKHRTEITDLSARYCKKVEYIDKLISTSAHYKHKRGVNIENAKLHAKAAEVNAGIVSSVLFFEKTHTFSHRSFCW